MEKQEQLRRARGAMAAALASGRMPQGVERERGQWWGERQGEIAHRAFTSTNARGIARHMLIASRDCGSRWTKASQFARDIIAGMTIDRKTAA